MKQLSVVIAAGSEPKPLFRCLQSLEACGVREECAVIVVSPEPLETPSWVRKLEVPDDSYAVLRAAGLAAAEAPLVAVLSEDYTVDAAWLARALTAGDADVLAGVTEPPGGGSLAERAAWLWEYAHATSALRAGPLEEAEAAQVPAGNVVYRRERLDVEVLRSSANELEYHRRLHRLGVTFRRDPGLVAVYHPPAFRQFLHDRSRWSAAWARNRARALPPVGRWAAAATRVLLPPLLLARFGLRIARLPRRWLTCVAALPLFAAFACAQAYGEARAYLEHD
jgi:hypothetical protein